MNNLFKGFFDCVKLKKGYFVFLVFLSCVAIVLGVIAAVNFGGDVFTIDLSQIAYIRFLSGDCGFMSMVFGLLLSLMVFFIVILFCNYKTFLLPFGILFYLYLVYSQAVIFVSIILIYGILNCIILAILLFAYSVLVWMLFLLFICEISNLTQASNYFRRCFSLRESKVGMYLICLIVLAFIFSFVLIILKNYVVLLIF